MLPSTREETAHTTDTGWTNAYPALDTWYRAPVSRPRRVLRRLGAVAFWTVACTVALLALLIFVIPWSRGGSGLTVLSGSMEPVISAGDVVGVRGVKAHEVCESVRPGDIVTFMPNEHDATLVTHRVVSIVQDAAQSGSLGSIGEDLTYEHCVVTTQGDANNVADEPVPARAVKGVVMQIGPVPYVIPKVGYALHAMQTSATFGIVKYSTAGAFLLAAVFFLVPVRRRSQPEPPYEVTRHDRLDVQDVAPWLAADGADEPARRCTFCGDRPGREFYVARTPDGEVVASGALDPVTPDDAPTTTVRVCDLVVSPERRREGWGARMLAALCTLAFTGPSPFTGPRVARVVITVEAANTAMLRIADQAGFTTTGEPRPCCGRLWIELVLTRQAWSDGMAAAR
jgi:signal peptidase